MTSSRLPLLALGLLPLLACRSARPPAGLPIARMTSDRAESLGKLPASVTGTSPLRLVGSREAAPASRPAAARTEAPASGGSALAAEPADVASTVLDAMDATASPCEDFYRYACGGWLASTKLPADRERWGRGFSVITERNIEVLRGILEESAKPGASDPDLEKIGRFYSACMDEAAVERAGAAPLQPYLSTIEGVTSPVDAFRSSAELRKAGIQTFFRLDADADFKDPDLSIAHVTQGGLSLPDRDYYLKDDERSVEIRKEYVAHVARMLKLSGYSGPRAREEADDILAFETELARISIPREELRDPNATYHKIDLEGLEKMAPALPWRELLAEMGYPGVHDVNVAVPVFYEGLNKIVPATKVGTLRAYLRWKLVHGLAPTLSRPFVDEDFAFFAKKLRGAREQQPRWKRCVNAVDEGLGEILGKAYVERKFPGDSKQVALRMIQDIEGAFQQGLPGLDWMDATTRGRALEKMTAITNKIGYPDRWRDYTTLPVGRTSHFENALAARRFEFDRNMSKIGKPVDKGEWGMTPPEVNAYYNPSVNEIVFPAGIMQAPFFDSRFPAPMNYGGIGMVMGHELTHGFDDEGRKFDGQGRLREWWDPAVSEKFDVRAKCVSDLYSTYEVQPGVSINGKLTNGENIADLGGLKESFRAYRTAFKGKGSAPSGIGSLTNDQLFFVGFAQTWCTLATPEIERMLVTVDPHSPPRFRVNGPASNLAEFAEAFSCPAGAAMRSSSACTVW